jgi:hypothetical protein
MKRDWAGPHAKLVQEGVCRVCNTREGLQTAHTIGRQYDPKDGRVRAVDTIPLCIGHHQAYDARELNLLPYLTNLEQAAAVGHVGLDRALRRLTSGQEKIVAR